MSIVMALSDCEASTGGFLGQPLNTLSSVVFLIAAVSVFRRRLDRPLALLMAAALGVVGAGSVLYHGPGGVWAHQVHDWGVALVGAVGVAAVVVACRVGLARRLLLPLSILGIGALAHVAGRTGGLLCDPGSWLQPHAAWHFLAAGGLAVLGLAVTRRVVPAVEGPVPVD